MLKGSYTDYFTSTLPDTEDICQKQKCTRVCMVIQRSMVATYDIILNRTIRLIELRNRRLNKRERAGKRLYA